MAQNRVTIDVEARFVDKLTGDVAKASKAVDDLGKKKPKVVIDSDTSNAKQKINKVDAELDNLGKKKVKPEVGVDDQASKKTESILEKLKRISERAYRATVSLKDNDALNTLAKIDAKINQVTGLHTLTMKLKDGITHPLSTIRNKLFSIKSLVTAITAGFAAQKFVINPVQQFADYEDLVTQFGVLLGSQSAAKDRIDSLTTFAGQTPFTRDEIYQASRVLQTYTEGALATPESTGGLKMIGDIAAATGAEYSQVATYMGRLYNEVKRGGESLGEPLAYLREMGALSAKQEAAIKKIATGSGTIDERWASIAEQFSGVDGMMQEMSDQTNNLLLGVKSFISNNIFKKLGEGIVSSLKPFLKDFRTWRSENSDLIAEVADKIKNFAADASETVLNVVRKTASRVSKIMQSDEFADADIFGKIGMLWKGAVANPFADWWKGTVVPWWEGTVVPWIEERAGRLGKTLGAGLSTGLLTLLGVDTAGMTESGVSIGSSFAKGFAEGFDASAVTKALVDAIQGVWDAAPAWLKMLIGGKVALSGASALTTLSGGVSAIGGFLGSAGKGTGLLGLGANTAIRLGAGNLAGGASLSAGALSALGLGGIAGGIAGGATALSGGYDLYKGYKEDDGASKRQGATKLLGVGSGAAIGALAGSMIPGLGTAVGGLIGAGVGGIASIFGAKGLEKWRTNRMGSSDQSTEAASGNAAAQKALEKRMESAAKAYKDSFGEIKLTSDEIQNIVSTRLSRDTKEMEAFTTATSDASSAMTSLNKTTKSLNKLSWKAGIQGQLSKEDSQNYKDTVDTYVSDVRDYVESKQYEFQTAADFVLDLDNDEDGVGAKFVEDTNAVYEQLQNDLDSANKTVKEKVDLALEDGVITADEEKIIQEAMAKVTEIKDKVAQAQNDASDLMIELKFGGGGLDKYSYDQMIQEILENTATKTSNLEVAAEAELTNLNLTYDKNSPEWQAGYDKIQSDFESELEKIELDGSNMAFELTGENLNAAFDNILGDDPGAALQAAMSSALEGNIDPISWTTDEAAQILGVESLSEQAAGAIGQALATLSENGFTVSEEALAGVGTSVVDATVSSIEEGFGAASIDMDASGIKATESSLQTVGSNTASAAQTSVQNALSAQGLNANAALNVTITSTNVSGLPAGLTLSGLNATGTPKKARGGIIYPFGKKIPGFSNGGTVRGGAQLITVAEEGSPEMIIPLSSQRRQRGLKLWEQAGHMMGVPGFANGGIVGGSEDEGIRHQNSVGGSSPSAGGMQVNVGGVTVEVNVSGGDGTNISQAIAEQGQEIAETVAGILADAFDSQFENTPNKGVA